jgi:probable HAF family extracellular repeat protein
MRRTLFSIATGSFFLLTVASCKENPNEVKVVAPGVSSVISPPATLDQGVVEILSLFPKGLETAATTRWANVKQKYAAGLSDPAQMTVAKQMLFELSDWLKQKTANMDNPPTGETKVAASARAVLYMSMYVYGGPQTSPPPFIASADNAVGTVTPSAPATIVTPTTHAGVQLEAGSVAENTIIVITQNPAHFADNCSGPLKTKFCQYPQFYTFEMFPHNRLLKAATFNVCHVNSGENRYPLADHDRFSLAHAKPADPANYVPGGKVFDGNGESIEVLPLVHQTFSTCVGNSYASSAVSNGPLGVLTRLGRGLQKLVTPKTAYAIDVGLGGLSFDTSPFNVLDTLSSPDLAVQSVSVTPPSARTGDHVALSFTVANIGTAARDTSHATIVLTPVPIEGSPPAGQQLGASFNIPPLAPGLTSTGTNLDVVIPQNASIGAYTLSLIVDDDPNFPDANLANNSAAATISVIPSVIDLGVLSGDSYSEATAINGVGQVVGWSGNTSDNLGITHAFIWQNGVMTNLGVTGGVSSRATGINDNGDVVGVITFAAGGEHAFRWRNGVTTDLGTLGGIPQSEAFGINTAGNVVGGNFNQGSRAWIWENGQMSDLGVLPGQSTIAIAINDAGQVAGYSLSSSAAGWIWQNGTVTFLGGLGGGTTQPTGINNSGAVVGGATIGPDQWRPFLWSNGVMTNLGTLGGTVAYANGISDDGRVVGVSFLASGVNHAFLWQGGHMTDLGALGGDYSTANAIRGGKIVGNAVTAGGSLRAALWNVPVSP